MHIPEGCCFSRTDGIKNFLEPLRIAVNAVCLKEQSNVHLFCVGNEFLHDGDNDFVVDLLLGSGIAVAKDTDIGCAELICELDVSLDLSDCLILCSQIVYGLAGRKARNSKL